MFLINMNSERKVYMMHVLDLNQILHVFLCVLDQLILYLIYYLTHDLKLKFLQNPRSKILGFVCMRACNWYACGVDSILDWVDLSAW